MNLVIIKGRLSKDPEIRTTANTGTKVASFSVAVQRKFKNQNGEFEADFFNVTSWGNQASFVETYFKKGQEILISGRLMNRSWETESGEKRYATDIVAENIEFCGSKKDNQTQNAVEGVVVNTVEDNSSDELPF
jgi:single-strand DNA-binding protein